MSFIASTLVDLAICLGVGYMFKRAVAPTPPVLKTETPVVDPPQEVMEPRSQTHPTPQVIAPFSTITAPLAVTQRRPSYSPQRDWNPSPFITEWAWSPSERSNTSYPKPMLPPVVPVTVRRMETAPKPAPVKEEVVTLVSPPIAQMVEAVPAPASSRRSVSPTRTRRSRKHVQRLGTPPPHSLRFKAIARQMRASKPGRPRKGSNSFDPGRIFDPMWENHLNTLHNLPYFSEPTGFAPRPFAQEEHLLVDRYSQLIDVVMDDDSWDTPDEDMSSETGSSTAHTDEEDQDVLMSDPEDDDDDDSMECDVDINTKGVTKVEEAEEAEEEKEQEEGREEESTTKAAAPRHMTPEAVETAPPVRKHNKGKLSSDSQTLASLSSPRDINMAGPIDDDDEEEVNEELDAPAKGKVEGRQSELEDPHQKTPSKTED